MKTKIFISHADIILDKIYDSKFNLVKQDGGGCNWNDLYNLSLMGEKCYAFGTCGDDEEGKIAVNSLKKVGVNTDNILIDKNIKTNVMNILLPDKTKLEDNEVIHTWYSPITNKSTMHFSDNLPLDIPKDFEDKEIYIIMDKFESINYEFINKIKNKKLCLDVGAEEFIEYFTKSYLTQFFMQANLMQLNQTICEYLFKKLQLKNEIEFFDKFKLDLLIITNGKKGAKFIYKENEKTKIVNKKPPILVDAIDTSGAGDAFFSTVIRQYAYCNKIDEKFVNETFDIANKSSREIITKIGSRG